MSYLLDTCVISELRKPSPQQAVLSWLNSCEEEDMHISSLSIGELHYGISILAEGKRKNDLLVWFSQVCDAFADRILPVTTDICIIWGDMRAKAQKNGIVLAAIDGLLAATAQAHNLVLVTRNTADVEVTGARILNPWEEQETP